MAKKDSSVKFGSTKCDCCPEPAVAAVGKLVVCARHSELIKTAFPDKTLKSAGITLQDAHE